MGAGYCTRRLMTRETLIDTQPMETNRRKIMDRDLRRTPKAGRRDWRREKGKKNGDFIKEGGVLKANLEEEKSYIQNGAGEVLRKGRTKWNL